MEFWVRDEDGHVAIRGFRRDVSAETLKFGVESGQGAAPDKLVVAPAVLDHALLSGSLFSRVFTAREFALKADDELAELAVAYRCWRYANNKLF